MRKYGRCALLAAALALGGCAESGMEPQQEKEPEETVVLEFYTWVDEKEYITDAVEAFMEKYPDISVNLHLIPSSEYQQTIAMLHNKEEKAVDLFAKSKPSAAASDVKKGFAADITEQALEGIGERTDYKELTDSLRMDGRIYMLPYRKSSWAVYYNKKIFEQAGIPYPDATWTWGDYTESAIAISSGSKDTAVYGSMSFESSSTWWRTPVRTMGQENHVTPRFLEAMKETARWNYQMAYEWKAQPAFTELVDVTSYDYASRFLNGNIAMFYCGDWAVEMLSQQITGKGLDFDYDIAPLPVPEEGPGYMPVTAAVLEVSSQSVHPEEALLLARFLAGEEGARILAEHGIIPAYDTEENREILKNSPGAPEHMEYFWEYDQAVYTDTNIAMEQALQVINEYVGQYFFKETGLEEAFESIEEVLAERGLMEEGGNDY